MQPARVILRAVLIIGCSLAGWLLAINTDFIKPPEFGLLFGFGLAMGVLMTETVIRQFSIKLIIGGAAGLIIGLGIAFLISYPLGRFMDSAPISTAVYVITACTFGYIGVSLGSGKIGELRIQAFSFLNDGDDTESLDKIMDTSSLIDGRIAEVIEAGFLDGRLVVPRFVLDELQAVADSSDPIKRQRGRRGMDVLARLQELDPDRVVIDPENPDQADEVDHKLIILAQRRSSSLVTTDFNLIKSARLQGVTALNINELAEALRPVVLPGETFSVQIIRRGKSEGQGVGYLEDGAMVVVDNAARMIGRTVDVTVASVLQTAAGRMIFTEPIDNAPPRTDAGDAPQ